MLLEVFFKKAIQIEINVWINSGCLMNLAQEVCKKNENYFLSGRVKTGNLNLSQVP
jgi:hypothetical protein